jgi:drug/metabolite transporter (DMT)-like permease
VSGIALALVLAAAVLHAGWNRVLHGAGDRLAAAAVGAAVGAVLLLPATIAAPPVRVWPSALASGAAEAVYFAFLAAAYRRGELSVTYPVARGIAPFLITLGGAVVLGQSLGAARIAGSLALGIGLAVISQAGLARGRGLALTFAALTGITIAAYSVIDAGAVRSSNAVGYLGAVTAVQAIILLGAVRLDTGRLRASARAGAGIGAGSVAAYLLVLLAYQRAPASPVATLRELSILLGILMARDRPGVRVWLGGALCVLGAALTLL